MSFYTDVIQKNPRFESTDQIRDLSLLEAITRAAVNAIVADALRFYGIVLIATETFRSRPRQKILFVQHATKLEDVGVHHFGLACDFAKMIGGNISWAGDWSFLRELAEKHGLISGLDWGQPNIKHDWVDPDHVQRCLKADENNLFSGVWYPDSEYMTTPATILA